MIASQFWSEYCPVLLYYLHNLFCKQACKGMLYAVDLPTQSIAFWILNSINSEMYTSRYTKHQHH